MYSMSNTKFRKIDAFDGKNFLHIIGRLKFTTIYSLTSPIGQEMSSMISPIVSHGKAIKSALS